MLAACYEKSGPLAGELGVVELPDPQPGIGEVRVRLVVSGVNPTDWKARKSGGLAAIDARLIVPGQDGAGVIDAVGDGVDPRRIGERVWVYNAQWKRAHGTAAQWISLPGRQAVPLSEAAPFELGASLGIPAMTAHRCLFGPGELAPGSRVLVHGGAGAVGHAAIELARWSGVRVAATVSSDEKAAIAASAGAELVVNYRSESVAQRVREWAPDGVARVIEIDLAANLSTDAQVLAPGATIACYSGGGSVELERGLMVLNASIAFVLVYTIPDDAVVAAVEAITRALKDGALTVLPLHRFPLSEIAAAHDAVEAGAVGKVIVEIP